MRIFAAADIHGKKARIKAVQKAVADHGPDIVVIAGDIANYVNASPVFDALNSLGTRVLTVRGNSDPFWTERAFARHTNIVSLDLRVIKANGIRFSGISGTVPVPFRTRFRIFEKQMFEQAAALMDKHTVFVTHPPPYGILDRVAKRFSAGSLGLFRLIKKCSPRLVICGHIHEDCGVMRVAGTLVVNCSIAGHGTGFIIDIEPEGKIGTFAV